MSEPVHAPSPADAAAVERSFYRDELAGHTLVVAVDPTAGSPGLEALAATVAALVDATARVVLVGAARTMGVAPLTGPTVTVAPGTGPDLGALTALWDSVRRAGVAAVSLGDDAEADVGAVADVAAALAGRLGVHKLVLTHHLHQPQLDTPGFVDEATLQEDPAFATAEWTAVVRSARRALDLGIPSVNLCRLEDLEQELFTYEGAGMLVTARSYLDVGPLRAEEFDGVDRLLRQGQAEGFLRPRSDDELARFLFIGFGARIATSGHLAGVGGLETEQYASERAGEIVGLYAISRFVGEGVGRQLVAALLDHAAATGLRGVFACTTSSQVVQFFERCGFAVVPQDRLPAAKCDDYDASRRADVVALWCELADRVTAAG